MSDEKSAIDQQITDAETQANVKVIADAPETATHPISALTDYVARANASRANKAEQTDEDAKKSEE